VESSLRARVAAIAEAEPALADALLVRGALIEIVDRAAVGVGEVRLPGELVRVRLAAGTPLLDRLDVPLGPAVARLFERLAVAMLADPAARPHAEATLLAVREHRLHAEQVVGEAVVGHDEHLTALAEPAGLPTPFLVALADLASRSLLAALATRLRPALALGGWGRGSCPVCGGRAAIGEQAGSGPAGEAPAPDDDQEVRLRCGRCATSWAWSLPCCPDCQAGALTALDALDADADGRWRLLGCSACHSYLKVAEQRRSDRLADLLVDDLVSWRLDRAALGHGLARPSGLGQRLEHGDEAGEELDDD
jgi:formate dehydrogenase maturation protein FdhE